MLLSRNVPVSKHLRREKKGAWMCHPTWKLDFKRPLIRLDYILPPQSPKTALRIVESVPPAKMLKKYLNYLNASVI